MKPENSISFSSLSSLHVPKDGIVPKEAVSVHRLMRPSSHRNQRLTGHLFLPTWQLAAGDTWSSYPAGPPILPWAFFSSSLSQPSALPLGPRKKAPSAGVWCWHHLPKLGSSIPEGFMAPPPLHTQKGPGCSHSGLYDTSFIPASVHSFTHQMLWGSDT